MIGYPRSLRGRTLLLTIVGIVACEFVTFAVLGAYRHALLSGRAHDFVNGQIEMVRSALTHAAPDEVARELERPFPGRRGYRPSAADGKASPQTDDPTPAPPESRARDVPPRDVLRDMFGRRAGPSPRSLARMRLVQGLPDNATGEVPSEMQRSQLVSALREEYGGEALRFTGDPGSAVWVRMSADDWWLMLPFARYSSPPVPWSIVLATLAAVGVMGGLVALYSFHLSKPLRALADAAARYTVGQHPALTPTGPDEIRAVTEQFNAMAERLERDEAERRVMLASLPHDLRAPLSRAKLRLELMDDASDDAPDSPKAGLARDLAEVGRIADQFVAYLRGLDHDTRNFKDTALNEIVRDRGLVWRESGHDITIARADVFHRQTDGDALMRAVDNLIGNAFAHGAAPVTVAGETRGTSGEASYRIVVRDHGAGIPPDRRAEALKPFTRLDAARGASGHCGLGLAVAQSVALLHGGHIELDDAAGGGLAATIVLPAA